MKVLVTDDNAIVRMGLKGLLAAVPVVEEVYEAANGKESLDVAARERPDVVLLDVRMPVMGGLEALPVLAQSAKVIMLTNADDADTIRSAMEKGASGYLVHGSLGLEEVAGAIAMCQQGGLVLGPQAAATLALQSREVEVRPNPLSKILSEREAVVLEAASSGMSNEEIAAEHFLSTRTVKNYLNSAYPKLGVHNRAEAVIAWREAQGS